MRNDPSTEIVSLAREIQRKTCLNWSESLKLAIWVYTREHPGFNEEALV